MAFQVGDYVQARHLFHPVGTTEFEALRDAAGRRTSFGQVLDPVPTAPTDFSITRWNPATSQVETLTTTCLVYSIQIWDIDLGQLVIDNYPELVVIAGAGVILLSPGPTFGPAQAIHYDKNALPPDAVALKTAIEAGK